MNHKNIKHILERKSAKNGDEQNELEILGANQSINTHAALHGYRTREPLHNKEVT